MDIKVRSVTLCASWTLARVVALATATVTIGMFIEAYLTSDREVFGKKVLVYLYLLYLQMMQKVLSAIFCSRTTTSQLIHFDGHY